MTLSPFLLYLFVHQTTYQILILWRKLSRFVKMTCNRLRVIFRDTVNPLSFTAGLFSLVILKKCSVKRLF